MRMRWSTALLLAFTAISALHARVQIVQDHAAADDVFDALVHRITACKPRPRGDSMSRIACVLKQVRRNGPMGDSLPQRGCGVMPRTRLDGSATGRLVGLVGRQPDVAVTLWMPVAG